MIIGNYIISIDYDMLRIVGYLFICIFGYAFLSFWLQFSCIFHRWAKCSYEEKVRAYIYYCTKCHRYKTKKASKSEQQVEDKS